MAAVVPVFPLPDVVLFPGTTLPLNVFEPRYREMVRDLAEGDRTLAITLLRPGYERDYEGSPAMHALGTIGRIENLEPQADGRFLLHVVGLGRARLEEVQSNRPYRLVQTLARPEREPDENDPEVVAAKLDLLATHACLRRELSGNESDGLAVDERLPFSAAVNGSCANLPIDAESRQRLLMIDDLLERQRLASRLIDRILQRILELKNDRDGRESHN